MKIDQRVTVRENSSRPVRGGTVCAWRAFLSSAIFNLQFRHFSRTCLVSLSLISLSLTAAPAFAQNALLTAEVASSSPSVRANAPITLLWNLKSQTSGLLEGRIELVVQDGNEILAVFVSDDLVLTAGDQLYRIVLPPLEVSGASAGGSQYYAVDIHAHFITKKNQKIPLSLPPLRMPTQWQRSFVLGVCDPWQNRVSPDKQRIIQSFRFETFNADQNDRTATTFPSHVRPEELTADALAFCGYDIVLLMNEGFADLKENQLQALRGWVQAGGSACIIPGNTVLRPFHAKFLNEAAELDPTGPQYLLDSAGRLMTLEDELGGVRLRHHGLGRVAIVRTPPEKLLEENVAEWRKIVGFLWKMRRDQLPTFTASGQWKVLTPAPPPGNQGQEYEVYQAYNNQFRGMRPSNMQLAPIPIQTGDQLLSRLMPRNMRVVPLWLIGLLMGLFVMLIGPGDYFILGALKLRKFTWIVFPVITCGFAFGIVQLSNWYMSFSDNRRSVVVYDIGEENAPVRRNRFHVLFNGTYRTMNTDVSRGLLTALNHQKFSGATWYRYQQAQMYGNQAQYELVKIPQYHGRVPTQYTVKQEIPQWTPQMNRMFQMGTDEQAVKFDWSQFADASVFTPKEVTEGKQKSVLAERLTAAFGNNSAVFVITGEKLHLLSGQQPFVMGNPYYPGQVYPAQYPYSAGINTTPRPASFLHDLCSLPTDGLFSVISQISPHGGKDFEDLSVLDPSAPSQWLLVVAVDQGDDLLIYRKLYAKEE